MMLKDKDYSNDEYRNELNREPRKNFEGE